ncbi:RimK family alpha-L-glutamate ligase [Patescibacteria group bacterium]|nr:RimK family alpha-L-glutamate ligase [Patescibacteria group bacterium]
MNIALITTLPNLAENERIGQEVRALNHRFKLIDLSTFSFNIKEAEIKVAGLEDLGFDVIIVRGIFNSIKPISVVVNSFRKRGVRVFDNNFIEHKYSIDKVTDLIKLAQERIPVPATAYSRDFSQYTDLAETIGYPLVVKSTRSGKGAAIFKIDNKKSLLSLTADLEGDDKKAKSFLLQKFIAYKFDLRVLVIGKQVFTMRRIPAEGEFRANYSLGGKVEQFDLDDEGRELAIKALRTVDMSVGGIDILLAEDGKKYILEVNHTAGFVGMEKALDKNIGKVYVEHAIANAK